MAKKKDSMAGMTAAQKASVVRGKQRDNKDKIGKLGSRIQDAEYGAYAGRLLQSNSDMDKTLGRLDSNKDRSARSAIYRLAKMKADKKMSKTSKIGRAWDANDLKGVAVPSITKTKKGKKK